MLTRRCLQQSQVLLFIKLTTELTMASSVVHYSTETSQTAILRLPGVNEDGMVSYSDQMTMNVLDILIKTEILQILL